ncbi:uncharacterized protein FMAN_15337 [Fusarium mangiferae]|uniref:Uncharacterized protein n=1 Tax=Fusarium mangiferae TaxID=192010 RepID=A0A1L7U936_FUSMA|nr:uncharacterized protein FMAN_15337 [Fusarium mangiferae]CVL07224.1 uncharacterized protein FMAN_15337 [Fusarium mangiferae]
MADEKARTGNDALDLAVWQFAVVVRHGMVPQTSIDMLEDLLVQCRITPRSSLLPGPPSPRLLPSTTYSVGRLGGKEKIERRAVQHPHADMSLQAIITARTGAKDHGDS